MAEIIAAYSLPDQVGSEYWLRLEQEGRDDDRATIDDAANLLDTLYDRDPCIEEEPPEEPPEEEPEPEPGESNLEPPVSEPMYWQTVNELLSFGICDEDGCDTLYCRVYRSHLDQPYKLVIEGGEQTMLTTMTEQVKKAIAVAQENYVDLEKPVHGSFASSWRTVRDALGPINPPTVTPDGGRLAFSRICTGLLLTQYDSSYDMVAIKVPRDENGQPASCRVLAMFAGTITEEELQPHEIDEEMDSVAKELACGGGGGIDVPGKPYSCYERVYNRILCNCSGNDSGSSFYTEPDVPCPDHWDDDISPGRHNIGSRSVIAGFVDCGEGEVSEEDMKRHEDICCVAGTPPECDTVYAIYNGPGEGPDIAALRAEYGKNVVVRPVGPKDGACGNWTTKYKRPNLDCCDEVQPLTAHPNNPTEITPNGCRELRVEDGREDTSEYVWTCSGTLYFRNGLNEIHGGRRQEVCAPDDLCENNVVRCDDGCSSVSMPLRAPSNPVVIPIQDRIISPTKLIMINCTGGIAPYLWSAGGDLTLIAGQGTSSALFEASETFCGTETVTVSDGCTSLDDCVVRSSAGDWVPIENPDLCNPPITTGDLYVNTITANGYKVSIDYENDAGGYLDGCRDGRCPGGTFFTQVAPGDYTLEEYCDNLYESYLPHEYVDGCCRIDRLGGWRHYSVYQVAYNQWEWVCYA